MIVTFMVAEPVPPAESLTITLASPVWVELSNDDMGPLVTIGETELVRFTLPAKPLRLSRLRIEVAKDPVG